MPTIDAPAARNSLANVCRARCAPTCRCHAQARALNDVTDELGADRARRRLDRQEHVRDARLPRSDRYPARASPTSAGSGSRSAAARFAANHEFAGAPVEVFQLQPRDLDRAQPQPRQQQHDRVVARPAERATVTRAQPPLQRRRAPSWPGSRCCASRPPTARVGQRHLGQPAQIRNAQQRPQLHHAALRRADRTRPRSSSRNTDTSTPVRPATQLAAVSARPASMKTRPASPLGWRRPSVRRAHVQLSQLVPVFGDEPLQAPSAAAGRHRAP